MAGPTELSLEEMQVFMINNGGKVTNHALVNYFKTFLTDPQAKDANRAKFKEYVNRMATVKHENEVKYLLLKKRYYPDHNDTDCNQSEQKQVMPPPYRAPPSFPNDSSVEEIPPEVPPRRRSTDKCKDDGSGDGMQLSQLGHDAQIIFGTCEEVQLANKMSGEGGCGQATRRVSAELSLTNSMNKSDDCEINIVSVSDDKYSFENIKIDKENKQPDASQISVKERMQRFNKMAANTEPEGGRLQSGGKKKCDRINGREDEDNASLTSLDQKGKDVWLIRAAQCDYQELAKLAAENNHLPRIKDPATGYTALHWAAKHGDENIAKLIAGTYMANVNVRTNGGYTPLHIAAQHGKDNFFDLLVKVYGADPNLRDWSGRKPHQYQHTADTSVSADTFHKIKARKKHLAERELGFLRIGSLNVRVKRTTEAFGHFLGVGVASRTQVHSHTYSKHIKSWGSADNIVPQGGMMPPPKLSSSTQIRKRRSKRILNENARCSQSTPSTPNQIRGSYATGQSINDSDSDGACGFDSNFIRGTKM